MKLKFNLIGGVKENILSAEKIENSNSFKINNSSINLTNSNSIKINNSSVRINNSTLNKPSKTK